MRRMILVLIVGALLLAFASTVALTAARYGTDGHDVLVGTHSADEIYGHGGATTSVPRMVGGTSWTVVRAGTGSTPTRSTWSATARCPPPSSG
jgi:hypothetical protein